MEDGMMVEIAREIDEKVCEIARLHEREYRLQDEVLALAAVLAIVTPEDHDDPELDTIMNKVRYVALDDMRKMAERHRSLSKMGGVTREQADQAA